ncbi:Gfo/Idh/MocA family oxidoreductase [Aestuariibacter halophilus]|uniref:Gfo/Idh/MocA family oxidoreductase n=1 Tax=Fluctibacter halophilus TaxID=226011 RepID=A0ABS8G3N2_9ALTE|nr:Gfo/Idh/MocA family oxidoreductase [Aestuariibacter halophilus]MCC2615133.1 Gfo/Idh/MocA family oxidoreductase [Aestuariibacter halophilus]
MRNVVLIGAGQIGSRHLQALAKSDTPLLITVVDPNEDSLNTAVQRYEQMQPAGEHILRLSQVIPTDQCFNVAILACNAAQRYDVAAQLLAHNQVDHIIFEKVLFQTVQHLTDMQQILARHGTRGWVNCGRRSHPFYQTMMAKHGTAEPVSMRVVGSHFGLTCNAIHFIDLFCALNGDRPLTSLTGDFSGPAVAAKRPGCFETFGELNGSIGDASVSVRCEQHPEQPTVQVQISGQGWCYNIDEIEGAVRYQCDGEPDVELRFEHQMQSDVTQQHIADLLQKGQCRLPKYADSCAQHRHYLHVFIEYFEQQGLSDGVICPIS